MGYLKLLWDFFRLRSNTNKSRVRIKAIQEKKLRELLLYAYDNSTYYRHSFTAAGISREDIPLRPLSAFPTMDKQILMEHFDELVTTPDLRQETLRRFDEDTKGQQDKFLEKYHVVHSSGSTGKPMYFVYDEAAWDEMLLGIIRAALWGMGFVDIVKLLFGGPRVVYIAATDGRYGGAMAVGGGVGGLNGHQLNLDIKTPLCEWVDRIEKFNPGIIIGYPSAIKILGELVENGQVHVHAKRVISCGEPLSSNLRQYFEDTFGAVVVNIYGASESLALGVEAEETNGMVLFDDLNVIEVENGTMYLTSLYNRAQPLIRYKMSDKLVMKEEINAQGAFAKAEILMGRNEDLLWFEDAAGNRDFLHPLAIEGFCVEGLLDFQFCQCGPAGFEMHMEVQSGANKAAIRQAITVQMQSILQEKKLHYVQFTTRFVGEILPDPKTGKKPLIKQLPLQQTCIPTNRRTQAV